MSVNDSKNFPDSGDHKDAGQKKEEENAGRTFFEKWKDPAQNKMGNDVSSEIKIANSGGAREEGYDKEWHMEEDSEKGDEEIREEQSNRASPDS